MAEDRRYLPPKVRRPREELNQAAKQLENMGLILSGSWRRGKKTVGDLDCLVTQPFREVIEFAHTIMGYTEIRGGDMKSEGICEYKGSPLLLNFWRVPSAESYAAMLLFSTGPFDLNIAMRSRAKGKGQTLSQYGLFDTASGNQLDTGYDEQDIFEMLDYPFLTPEQREDWRDYLIPKPPKKHTVTVHSSDGVNTYFVVIENGKATECECKGWTYRHHCRHLEEAEELFRQKEAT